MTEKRIWWITVFFCSFLIFAGDSLFNNRPESDQDRQYRGTWTHALIQNAAFPILIPLFFIFSSPEPNPQRAPNQSNNGSVQVPSLYVSLGVLVSVYSKLYAMEKLYVGWGVLLSTQLILTSLFSPFINRLKFNRWIIISIFLTLVAHFLDDSPAFSVNPDENESDAYDKKAWLILIFPSLAFSLSLCLMKFGFEKVLVRTRRYGDRKEFRMVLEMQICVSFIATFICTIGLFASGEYKELREKNLQYYEFGRFGSLLADMDAQAIGSGALVSGLFADVVHMCSSPFVALPVGLTFDFMTTLIGREELFC